MNEGERVSAALARLELEGTRGRES